MEKHLYWEIKYNYLIRYINWESPSKLGYEMQRFGLIAVLLGTRSSESAIFRFKRQYSRNGIEVLKTKYVIKSTSRTPNNKRW